MDIPLGISTTFRGHTCYLQLLVGNSNPTPWMRFLGSSTKVYIYLFELLLRIVVERPLLPQVRRWLFSDNLVSTVPTRFSLPPKKTEAGGKKTSGYDTSSYIFITNMIWINISFTKLQSYGIAVMPWSSSSHIFKWGYGPPKRIICRFHETILRRWLHL